MRFSPKAHLRTIVLKVVGASCSLLFVAGCPARTTPSFQNGRGLQTKMPRINAMLYLVHAGGLHYGMLRERLCRSKFYETVGELIRGLTVQPYSAFQRTLAISPQFIVGWENNALTKVLGVRGLSSTLSKINNLDLLYRQNPSFLAKTFSISLIFGEN